MSPSVSSCETKSWVLRRKDFTDCKICLLCLFTALFCLLTTMILFFVSNSLLCVFCLHVSCFLFLLCLTLKTLTHGHNLYTSHNHTAFGWKSPKVLWNWDDSQLMSSTPKAFGRGVCLCVQWTSQQTCLPLSALPTSTHITSQGKQQHARRKKKLKETKTSLQAVNKDNTI